MGQLDLNLEGVPGGWVAPVVGLREAGGGSCRNHGAGDVGHGEAELAGAFAVDIDVESREIACLRNLKIAQEWEFGHLSLDFFREGVIVVEADTLDRYLDGSGRAEAHHL